MLIAGLRNFTGKLPPAYAGEQEFFLTSLNNMAKHMYDLQKGTLEGACAGFILSVDSGKFTMRTINEFKSRIDTLVSAADFRMVSGCMIGGKDLIKKRLSALKPVSMIDEGNKTEGADPEALRHIDETYARLNFAALEKKMKDLPGEDSVNAALAAAREEVGRYCRLYRVPLNEEETMAPFSLACVDAALAASFRLFNKIYRSSSF